MEDKHTALVALGIVVVLAIIGLVLLFKTASTGATIAARANQPYPGIVMEYPGAVARGNVQGTPFPYYREDDYWSRKRAPELTYRSQKGRCDALVRLGLVPAGFTWDANIQQSRNRGPEQCIVVENSLRGNCCKPPTSP
ncbi:hypothetical protein KY346_05620 [Candidatus Woesearchaeota archaeon]|nr:hypothetical protein [Candidatus Woesearchaeota archaeon]